MAKAKEECEGHTYESHSGTFPPCDYPGKYFEDGKHWCGIHAPSKMKARREKNDAKYARERAIDSAKSAVKAKERDVVVAAEAWNDPPSDRNFARGKICKCPACILTNKIDALGLARETLAKLKKEDKPDG